MIISRFVSTANQLLTLKRFGSKAVVVTSASTFRCYASQSFPKKDLNMARVKKKYDNIIKSSGDKREYRGLELNNGLKVVLISDPAADKSAAAIAVQVGFMSDPDNLPGLAHFCEHMLFLGTKKYPEENEYAKYLTQHGGASNAYTATDYTCYYFDVAPEHLPGALDRFAQFFLEPLFTEGATDREVNAVNSEHEKNLQTDAWRLNQLKMSCSKKGHPFGKFGTGNIDTLDVLPKQNGVDVRQELLNFHSKWYSSNIMNLAILGKESLDDLEDMVTSMFSEIINKDVELPPLLDHPFSAEQVGYKYYVTSIKDVRDLTILFPIPDLRHHYKSSPTSCISHVIGHEGPGSLLSALKARSWCNSLVIGTRSDHRGFDFIYINVDLTETGIDNVDNIIHLLFQYITELKEEGPEKWKIIFDECKGLSNIHFRFKDKELPRNYVTHIVSAMQIYPVEEVLSANYTLTDWKPELIEDLLKLLTPENIWVSVLAKKFKDVSNEKEKWYGTDYKKEKIQEELKKKWSDGSKCSELHLPDQNDFIPTNFDVLPREENPLVHPSIIHQTQFCRVWYRQDDEFLLPKVNNSFEFISPLAYIDPLSCSMTYMFSMLFKDALNEFAYSAELAGLKWDLINTKYGMVLSIGGYNDKQKVFLEKIMEKMTNFKIDPKRFEILKENYIRGLKNFSAEQPYQQAVYYLALLLSEQSWSKNELKDAAEAMTLDKLEAFIPRLLSQLHVEALFHGNTTKPVCLDMMKTVMDRLDSSVSL